jgi:hypothetical protein
MTNDDCNLHRDGGIGAGISHFLQQFPANPKPEEMAICDQLKWLLRLIVS